MRWRADPHRERFFALRTFRSDGSAVTTPVWLAADRARWVGFTPERSGKVRRIRRDPHVELAPSDFDGRATGDWVTATARILPDGERRAAVRLLTRKYGTAFRTFRVVLALARRGRGVGFEVSGR